MNAPAVLAASRSRDLRTGAVLAPSAAIGATALALVAGLLAALGFAPPALAVVAAVALTALGAAISLRTSRTLILASLLFVPDFPLGHSLGLLVHWSNGLTLSNFVVPGLALPLLLGAWLAGRRPFPRHFSGLALGLLALLAWGALTLLPPLASGSLSLRAALTLAAHILKLALFILIGVFVAGDDGALIRCDVPRLLLAGIAANALFGLAQAARAAAVFSPLAGLRSLARATGFFYDANMFAIVMAAALLALLCLPVPPSLRRRLGLWVLRLLVAAALAVSASRAGWLAFAAGALVLLARRQWRALASAALLCTLLFAVFPARSWQRLRAAALTLDSRLAPSAAPASLSDPSTAARLATMAQAWRQYLAHPVLGLGFGRALYLGVPALSASPVRSPIAPVFQGAQNTYLTVLAETGPVGLALLVFALADPLRRLRRPRDPYSIAALAGFVALLAASFTLEALLNARLLALTLACLPPCGEHS